MVDPNQLIEVMSLRTKAILIKRSCKLGQRRLLFAGMVTLLISFFFNVFYGAGFVHVNAACTGLTPLLLGKDSVNIIQSSHRTKDTMGTSPLSFVRRLSLSQRFAMY